mmetsp:Transcript_59510/g.110153  ORF Transcript_59510/g.110153 Transcript_59510/m.110153 type:complete len:466 (-) Transcript_59510:52-1449(-)
MATLVLRTPPALKVGTSCPSLGRSTWGYELRRRVAFDVKLLGFAAVAGCATQAAFRAERRRIIMHPFGKEHVELKTEVIYGATSVTELERVCHQHIEGLTWTSEHQAAAHFRLEELLKAKETALPPGLVKMLVTKTELLLRAGEFHYEDASLTVQMVARWHENHPELLQSLPALVEAMLAKGRITQCEWPPKAMKLYLFGSDHNVWRGVSAFLADSPDSRVERFSEETLSMVLMAAAAVRLTKHDNVVVAIVDHKNKVLAKLDAKDLCNVLEAALSLELGEDKIEPLVTAFVSCLSKAPGKMSTRDLSRVLRVAAPLEASETLDRLADSLLPIATLRILDGPGNFYIQDLVDVLICCVKYNRYDRSLFHAVLQEVQCRIDDLGSHDLTGGLAGILWAQRQAGEVPNELLHVVSSLITPEVVSRLDKQTLFHLLWSYDTLAAQDRAPYRMTIEHLREGIVDRARRA